MPIEFVVLPQARQELLDLLTPRVPEPGGVARFGGVFIDDMEDTFRRHDGRPPGTERRDGPQGSRYWWLYVEGVWVGFRIGRRRVSMFRTLRVVTVTAVRSAPPPAAPTPPGSPP
jgi:hypothetical protein